MRSIIEQQFKTLGRTQQRNIHLELLLVGLLVKVVSHLDVDNGGLVLGVVLQQLVHCRLLLVIA